MGSDSLNKSSTLEHHKASLLPVYEEICGDSSTYQLVAEEFDQYLKSSIPQLTNITKLSSEEAVKHFGDFLASGNKCHEESPAAKGAKIGSLIMESAVNRSDTSSQTGPYTYWREYVIQFIELIQKLKDVVTEAQKTRTQAAGTKREILLDVNRIEAFAKGLDSQVKFTMEFPKGQNNLSLEMIIVKTQKERFNNFRNSTTFLRTAAMFDPMKFDTYVGHFLHAFEILFDPFNWITTVVDWYLNDGLGSDPSFASERVTILTPKNVPQAKSLNAPMIWELLDRLILSAATHGTKEKPIQIKIAPPPDDADTHMTITLSPFTPEIWADIEQYVGRVNGIPTMSSAAEPYRVPSGEIIIPFIKNPAVATAEIPFHASHAMTITNLNDYLRTWRALLKVFLERADTLSHLVDTWLKQTSPAEEDPDELNLIFNLANRQDIDEISPEAMTLREIKLVAQDLEKTRVIMQHNSIGMAWKKDRSISGTFVNRLAIAQASMFNNAALHLRNIMTIMRKGIREADDVEFFQETMKDAHESFSSIFSLDHIRTSYEYEPATNEWIAFELPEKLPTVSTETAIPLRKIVDLILLEVARRADTVTQSLGSEIQGKFLSMKWDGEEQKLVFEDMSEGLHLFKAFDDVTEKSKPRFHLEELTRQMGPERKIEISGNAITIFISKGTQSTTPPQGQVKEPPAGGNAPPQGTPDMEFQEFGDIPNAVSLAAPSHERSAIMMAKKVKTRTISQYGPHSRINSAHLGAAFYLQNWIRPANLALIHP